MTPAEELDELLTIARAISSERKIDRLLGLILEKSRYITGADAGSVYIIENRQLPLEKQTLRFMVAQNDSVKIDFREFTIPVDGKSIVGHSVLSREVINIPDLYQLDENNRWGFVHDRKFDEKIGYQAHSMLSVPMINQADEVIGVIQLINKRTAPLSAAEHFAKYVVPFDQRAEELLQILAAQAAVSLDNALLYEEISRLFEGFISASVTAIEARDPTTSGHSLRVAKMTVELAQTVDRESAGVYRDTHFTADDLKEIEYAGLLHDFGKVGVRENVLVKSKKLYDGDREILLARFDLIRRTLEAESLKKKLALMAERASADALLQIDHELAAKMAELDDYVAVVLKANEPTVMAEGDFARLKQIAQLSFLDPRGATKPYLTAAEVTALSLSRGSLTVEERLEIERHVTHTFNFLENVPWGRRFGKLPQIAGAHHEKLDGSGYPHGLKADQIRVESKMMTITDIFDALTAKDRPYKRAVPLDKALDILGFEVKGGKCDPELFRIFVDAKVWQNVLG